MNSPAMEYANTSLSPVSARASSPMSPCLPASMMTMNPTTTPGNASGNVISEIRIFRPKNRLRSRKRPDTTEITSVAMVTLADNRTVAIKLSRYRGVVRKAT